MESIAIAVKTAGSAVRFVEGGPLAEALAQLNMSAAISALTKAGGAVDKISQVWSAVNHLEAAQAALDSKLQGPRGTAQVVLRANNYALLSAKRAYVLALMGICYLYLGEEQLAQDVIALGRASSESAYWPAHIHWLPKLTGAVIAIANPIDTVRQEEGEEKYKVDWARFELPVRDRSLSSPEE